MKYYQLLDIDLNHVGIIALDEKLYQSVDIEELYKEFGKETDTTWGDADGFVDWLADKKIVAERIFTTEIKL